MRIKAVLTVKTSSTLKPLLLVSLFRNVFGLRLATPLKRLDDLSGVGVNTDDKTLMIPNNLIREVWIDHTRRTRISLSCAVQLLFFCRPVC